MRFTLELKGGTERMTYDAATCVIVDHTFSSFPRKSLVECEKVGEDGE